MGTIARGLVSGRAGVADRLRSVRAVADFGFVTVRARATAEPPRRRLLWLAVVLVLSLVPATFNAARETSFTASVEIFPRSEGPYPGPADPAYYRSLLADLHLQGQMLANVQAGPAEYQDASVAATGRGTVVLSLATPEPERSPAVLEALGLQLMNASARQLNALATREAATIRGQLRFQALPAAERRPLRRKLRAIRRLVARPSHRAVLAPVVPPPKADGWADRAADRLPGSPPEPTSPARAGLAGLLLAGTLWVIGLIVAPSQAPPSGARRERAGVGPAPSLPGWMRVPERFYGRAVAALGSAFVLIVMVAGARLDTFRQDEWAFVANRQGYSLDDFFAPHNEHLSTIPVVAFKALFETVGLEPYWPYRLVVAALAVGLGALVYVYAVPRLGRAWALALAALAMLVGQGGYDIFWPFQIGFDLSVACGVAMLLCFDRPGRRSDLIASGLLAIALLSSSVGLAVLGAAVVEAVLSRGQRIARGLRILAAPLVLYAVWWVSYTPSRSSDSAAPGEAVKLVFEVGGTAFAALLGAPLSLRPLFGLALIAVLLFGLLRRAGPLKPLMVAAALPGTYWLVLVLGRGSTGEFLLDSRYILPGSIFVACVLAEAFRDAVPRARVGLTVVVALALLGATANNIRYLQDAVDAEAQVRADRVLAHAAALSVAAQAGPVDPRFELEQALFPLSPPDRLAEAFKKHGRPVDNPDAVISGSEPPVRAAADRTYFGARGLQPQPAGAPPAAASCRVLRGPSEEILVPNRGVALGSSGRGPVSVAVRRWGATPIPAGAAPERGWTRYVPGEDGEETPVRATIEGSGVRVCRL